MNTSNANQGSNQQQNQPVDSTGLPSDHVRKLNFLLGLYPEGRDLQEIIEEVMKKFQVSSTIASTTANGLLKEYKDKEGLIDVFKRRNGTMLIKLSKKGDGMIKSYLSFLKDSNKEKFFNYLKVWIKKGDDYAKKIYKKESMLTILEMHDVACLLMQPTYESDVIDYTAKNRGVKNDNELSSKVINYVGRLIGLNFATSKIEGGRVFYRLTPEGRRVVTMMAGFLSRILGSNKKKPEKNGVKGFFIKNKDIWIPTFFSIAVVLITWSSLGDTSNVIMLSMMLFSAMMPVLCYFIIDIFSKFIPGLGKKR